MPDYCVTSNQLFLHLCDGSEKVKQCQHNLYQLIQIIAHNVWGLYYQYEDPEEKIEMMKSLINIYESFHNTKDYYFFHCHLHLAYRYIGAIYADKLMTEETIDYISKAANHAIAYDCRPDNFTYKSVFFKGYKDSSLNSSKDHTHNETWILMNKLKQNRYDFLREDNRLKKIEKDIKKYAKE